MESQLPQPSPAESARAWSLATLAGRFVEISGAAASAALTTASSLILQAQGRGEPVAWITDRASTFYPPDFAASGVDLAALPVVRAGSAREAAWVADALLRSGGFGLLVLDLGDRTELPIAWQSRLAGLAKRHEAVLLCLTSKSGSRPSLGSLVSIRGESSKQRRNFDRFTCALRVLKDKRRGPGWEHQEVRRGSDGLC
ncbi:MAG TPA: recombinase A [Planctomycetota bacterium]